MQGSFISGFIALPRFVCGLFLCEYFILLLFFSKTRQDRLARALVVLDSLPVLMVQYKICTYIQLPFGILCCWDRPNLSLQLFKILNSKQAIKYGLNGNRTHDLFDVSTSQANGFLFLAFTGLTGIEPMFSGG